MRGAASSGLLWQFGVKAAAKINQDIDVDNDTIEEYFPFHQMCVSHNKPAG